MIEKAGSHIKILIISDDSAIHSLAQQISTAKGHHVFIYKTGWEGLAAVPSQQFDLLVLDVMLPDTEGYAVLSQLRRENNRLPVLMMTPHNDDASLSRAYEAGATDFIAKPIRLQVLIQRIRYLLRTDRTQKALEKSETRARKLVEALPDMLFRVDLSGTILEVNRPKEGLFVDIPKSLVGRKVCHVAPVLLANKIRDKFHLAIRDGGSQIFEYGMRQKRQLLVREIRLYATNDREVMILLRDVTDRRRAERESRRRMSLYRALFNNNHASMLLIDPNTFRIVDANPAACYYYGYSWKQLTGMEIFDINILHQNKCKVKMKQAHWLQNNFFQFQHRRADGTIRDVEVCSGPIAVNGRSLLYSIIHDVTDRRYAEQKLINANRLLHLFGECNAAVARADQELSLLKNICRLMVEQGHYQFAWVGYAGTYPTKKIYPVVHWGGESDLNLDPEVFLDPPDACQEAIGRAVRDGHAVIANDLKDGTSDPTLCDKDRQSGFVSNLVLPLINGQNVIGVLSLYSTDVCIATDDEIALLQRLVDNLSHGIVAIRGRQETKKGEVILRRREQQYRDLSHEFKTVLDGIPDSLVLFDQDFRIVWANHGAQSLMDSLSLLAPGNVCLWSSQDETKCCDVCLVRRCFASGQAEADTRKMSDGKVIEVKVFPLRDERGRTNRVIRLISDVTENIRFREDQMRSSRLASLGELAAGVAHEINNPTGLLLHNLPLIEEIFCDLEKHLSTLSLPSDLKIGKLSIDRAREVLPLVIGDMLRGVGQIKSIVDDLKNYARKEPIELTEEVNLNDVVDAALRLLSNTIKKMTDRLTINLADDLPRFRGCFQRIEQVVINLIQNACQSLSDRSKGIWVETRYCTDTSCLILEIHDEGRGIAAEHLEFVTDPFFTTRRNDGGTGLGLSVSSHIVKAHGGKLSFRSKLGSGTSTTLKLTALPRETCQQM